MLLKTLTYLSDYTLGVIGELGYWGALLFSILDRVTIALIPAEILVPAYGALIEQGKLLFLPTFLIISFGNLAGEFVIYWLSQVLGRNILEKYGKYFLVSKHDLKKLDVLFAKHGAKLVFWGRFIPVARSIVAIPAGISKLKVSKFLLFSFLGLLPYNLLLILIGSEVSERFDSIKYYYGKAEIFFQALFVAAIIWYIWRHLQKKHLTHE